MMTKERIAELRKFYNGTTTEVNDIHEALDAIEALQERHRILGKTLDLTAEGEDKLQAEVATLKKLVHQAQNFVEAAGHCSVNCHSENRKEEDAWLEVASKALEGK